MIQPNAQALFSALLHEHLSVWIKTRLERHLLLKSKLRIDSRENRYALGRSPNRSTNRFCIDLSSQPYVPYTGILLISVQRR